MKHWMAELAAHYEKTRRLYPQDKLMILFSVDGTILETPGSFPGLWEVIRWFQIQPETEVGLNTSRPETLRTDILDSVNKLGRPYRVHFNAELLHMNPAGREKEGSETKVAGVRHFQAAGYRIFAMVDDDPENLRAVAAIDPAHEILLLHADTIFRSKRTKLPPKTVKGEAYDLTELIPEKALPQKIQFVWHGINDRVNLRQFLASEVPWGEFDIRLDPSGQDLILRHDAFAETLLAEEEAWLSLDDLLSRLHERGKAIKLDFKEGGVVIDKVLQTVQQYGFPDSHLWFNSNVERLQEAGFRRLAEAHPAAILQCPVDFLAPLICSDPHKAKAMLDRFAAWGINRFSLSWLTPDKRDVFNQIDAWGFEINLYGVFDLASFLQAVLLLPRSVTADFNFPQWYYYGRGSGQGGDYYEYVMRPLGGKGDE